MINTTAIRGTFSLSTIGATYATPYKVLSSSYMVVKLIRTSDDKEVTLSEGTDYTITAVGGDSETVSLAPYEAANNVADWTTYDTGPWQLLLTLDISILQENNFKLNGRLSSELIEDSFDLLTQILQLAELGIDSDGSSLAIAWPDNEPSGTSGKLPSQAERNGKLAGWDSVTGEWVAVDLDADNLGGMTGPASQVEGNLATYSATQGVLTQDDDISKSLFLAQTLVYGATVNWDSSLGHIATLNLSGNPTLNVTNIKPGVYKLLVNQDVTGGRTITFNTGFGNVAAVSLNTDSNGFSSLAFTSDGTTVYFDGSSSAAQAAAGQVGTYQDFAYDISAIEDDVGYLMCSGGSYSVTKYADLFAKIGYTYGGSGANFNTPDLNTLGKFRRASTTAGTDQAEGTAVNGLSDTGHSHGLLSDLAGVPALDHTHADPVSGNTSAVNGGTELPDGTFNQGASNLGNTESTSANLTGDAETRPINISAVVGIKF